MNASTEGLFGQLLEPVFRALPREATAEIAELTADPQLQDRIAFLASRCNEGELTADERAEYEALIEAGDMFATLQAIARSTLNQATR